MDGIHDLGGKHGFGKVDVNETEEQFHEAWEARVRGLVTAMQRAPDWTIDWFRHCRELIDPVDYLSRPYLDQWIQTYCAMLVNSGWATVDELANGKSQGDGPKLGPPQSAAAVHAQPMRTMRFDGTAEAPPAFSIGDGVVTITDVSTGHTRLPAYARAKRGEVIRHHGAHVDPEDNAMKNKHFVHLYTVEFASAELWPEAGDTVDTVTLDLWERYLVRG